MNSVASSFVVASESLIPRHLTQRQPFVLGNAEIIFRHPQEEVLAKSEGRVLMAGAIEFQTQIAPGILTDVCDPNEIYKPEMCATHRFRCVYDPEIQRGVKETKTGSKEFLREEQIKSMVEDIEANRFECPQLMWNLRAADTVWVYVQDKKELRIFQGVATRPDTNHRHHAIIRFHRQYLKWMAETQSDKMGTYNPNRAYGLVLYSDDFKGEAHRFYVYNFLGWRVSTTTAHYIESKTQSPHIHSRLARELMERSGVLGTANVEILSNQLSKNSAKMVTFGTLVEALRVAFPDLLEESYGEVLEYLVEFFGELSRVRPKEIMLLSVVQRRKVRDSGMADQAVVWHGYIRLAATLYGQKPWKLALQALAEPNLFDRGNSVWGERGMLVPGKSGVPRVVNNRQSRQAAFEILKERVVQKLESIVNQQESEQVSA